MGLRKYGAHIRVWVWGMQRWRYVRREDDGNYILVTKKTTCSVWEDLNEAQEIAQELPPEMTYQYEDWVSARGEKPHRIQVQTGNRQVRFTMEYEG